MLRQFEGKAWELMSETSVLWLVLIAVIIVAALLIVRIRARYCGREDSEATEHQLLLQIRELHREGDLTEEEFRSIKGRLASHRDDSTHNS